jgi:hypothetical protein
MDDLRKLSAATVHRQGQWAGRSPRKVGWWRGGRVVSLEQHTAKEDNDVREDVELDGVA